MSLMVATRRGSKAGILFRDAVAIERLGSVDALVVDKTGVLTEGKPSLATVVPLADWDEMVILRWAASLERASEHPLPAAIAQAAEQEALELDRTSDFRRIGGMGATARVPGHSLALGNAAPLQELGIDVAPFHARAEAMRAEGQTTILSTLSVVANALRLGRARL
jgi:Cu+-exporting ATPase